MDAETSQFRANPSSEESITEWLIDIKKDPAITEWLIDIKKDAAKLMSTSNPQIKKVDTILRNIKSDYAVPSVVSLGPLHNGGQKFSEMEIFKRVTALWFITLAKKKNNIEGLTDEELKSVYLDFCEYTKADMSESFFKGFYGDELVRKFSVKGLMKMMFLDGCFILHFIHLVLNGSDDMLKKSSYLDRSLILNDMFLLENQIPYSILEALMALKGEHDPKKKTNEHDQKKERGEHDPKKEIAKFIHTVFIPPYEIHFSVITIIMALFCLPVWLYSCFVPWFHSKDTSDGQCRALSKGGDPVHLLGHLQSILITGSKKASSPSKSGSGQSHYNFRPIRELQAKGIQVSRSNSSSLKDVKFRKGIINSHLELPAIVIDDSSKTRLLNLAAYEICDKNSDRMVTSYICFLRSLIYHPTDVKELRSKEIIINHHGSDAQVSTILKDVAKNLSPNYDIYSDVIKDIERHMSSRYSKHVRLWIGQLNRRYFTSPWTVMSLIAAILLIILTLMQTVYSVLSYNKSN